VRGILQTGRFACLPNQVSVVQEAVGMLQTLVRGAHLGLCIPHHARDWLYEWRTKLRCREVEVAVDAVPTFGFPFFLAPAANFCTVMAAQQLSDLLYDDSEPRLQGVETLLHLARFWLEIAEINGDEQEGRHAYAQHVEGQDSGFRLTLPPLAVSSPLIVLASPNPYHLLLELDPAASVAVLGCEPAPMPVEGGEAGRSPARTEVSSMHARRTKRSTDISRPAHYSGAASRQRRKRSWFRSGRRRGGRWLVSVPDLLRPAGPAAARVGRGRVMYRKPGRGRASGNTVTVPAVEVVGVACAVLWRPHRFS
jgi:hypothetical protein